MKQKPLRPPVMLIFAAAFAFGGALASSALADTNKPRVLTLTDRTDAVLPGDHSGNKLGITIRRGSGFPEPVIADVVEEEAVETPAPVPRIIIRRDRYRY